MLSYNFVPILVIARIVLKTHVPDLVIGLCRASCSS